MANYDASVRVNTKVDNSDLKALKREFDDLSDTLKQLNKSKEKLEAKGIDKQGKTWQMLEERIDSTKMAIENVRESIQEVNATVPTKGFEKLEKSSKKCFKTMQTGTKKTNGLLSTFSSRLKGIALSLLVFNWITKGFNAMVNAMKEGFHNLAQYSDEYNASMSALKSQTEQLKNGLASAFEPIVNIIIPYLTQLVSWLNTAADSMAQFLAALQGKSTYTRAKKQMLDYAKSLDTASKSAKGALASFDQLNVLNHNNVSSGGAVTGADAFETAEISNGMNGVMSAIQPFRDILVSFVEEVDLEPLLSSFERLKTSAEPFGTYLYEGLLWFLNDILVPFAAWSIEDAMPAFFDLLSATLDILSLAIETLKPLGTWLWNELLQPMVGWVADTLIDGVNTVTTALEKFGAWCKGDKEGVDLMSSVILGFFAGIMTYYTAKKIVTVIGLIQTASAKFIAIVSAGISPIALAAVAIGVLAAGIIYLASNWDKLDGAQKAITILGALAAAAIAAAVAIAVFHTAWSVGIAAAAIVGGLALLGLTSACLKSNGDTSESVANDFYSANDFSGSPLPMLADGAVIPGGRPFAAILGDQPAGQTNIEAPISTIEDAVQNVYDRNGGTGEINLNIYLDSEPVYKSVVKRDKMYQKATGHSAFVY